MNNSKKGKFSYGVYDKLMGGYQGDDEYFDTITECVNSILAQDEIVKKSWKKIEIYECMNDEGDLLHVVLRLQYRHKDFYVY